MGLEIGALLKMHLIMHVFLRVCSAAALLSNSEYLQEYTTGFLYGGQKKAPNDLGTKYNRQYPAGNVMLKASNDKTRII